MITVSSQPDDPYTMDLYNEDGSYLGSVALDRANVTLAAARRIAGALGECLTALLSLSQRDGDE